MSNFIVAVCAPRRVQNRDSSVALSIMADLILLVPVQHLLASPVMLLERERATSIERVNQVKRDDREQQKTKNKKLYTIGGVTGFYG